MSSNRHRPARATPLLAMALALLACGQSDTPKGNPVAENCGFANSPGNDLAVGKYCTKSADCPAVQTGTALQCSTVLVDSTLPLLCSRLCDLKAADPGCGTDAVCKNILELGIDLTVCVPVSCQPLFSEPLQ